MNHNRRPKGNPLTTVERRIIDKTWEETRFGARLPFHKPRHGRCHILHRMNVTIVSRQSMVNAYRTSVDRPHTIIWLDNGSFMEMIEISTFMHAPQKKKTGRII